MFQAQNWPFSCKNYIKLEAKFRISTVACTYIRNDPHFFEVRSALLGHFWYMHHNAGEYGTCPLGPMVSQIEVY